MTESPVLGKVRKQFADLEQSSLRNDNFWNTVTDVDDDSPVKDPL